MKLNIFTPDNTNSYSRRRGPAISINVKGSIRINPAGLELIGATDKHAIVLHQDGTTPEDWYLEVVKSGGFPLRSNMGTAGGLITNSAGLVKKIFASVGFDGKSGVAGIAPEPVKFEGKKLWPLITARLKA